MRSYVVPVRIRRYYALLFMRNNVDLTYLLQLYSVCLQVYRPMDTCMYARRENVVPVKLRFPLAKNALHSPTSKNLKVLLCISLVILA